MFSTINAAKSFSRSHSAESKTSEETDEILDSYANDVVESEGVEYEQKVEKAGDYAVKHTAIKHPS